jgi:hypothetical protein
MFLLIDEDFRTATVSDKDFEDDKKLTKGHR